jgi:hypothetical protein
MPLYVKNNALLKVGSSLSADLNCCCGSGTCGNFFYSGTCVKCSDFPQFTTEQQCKDAVDAMSADPANSCVYKWIGTTAQCLCKTNDTECKLIKQTNNTVWSQYQTKTKSCTDGIPGHSCTFITWCPCDTEPSCPSGTSSPNGTQSVYLDAIDCSNIGNPYLYYNCGSRSAATGVGPFCTSF